jgi:hypothetical protein
MSYLTDTAPLLPAARALVIKHQRGSISLVQRYLQIGYNAASDLLWQLERDGVCGQLGQFGGRDVLIRSADLTDADKAALEALDRGHNPPMPQSNKEKQEAFRARQAMLGLTEVRGIYLPPELHQKLKDEARRMLDATKQKDAKP